MRPTADERRRGRLAVANLRLERARSRAARLGLDPDTNPGVLAAARNLEEVRAELGHPPPPPPATHPQPRPRRDIDGPPEE